MTNEDTADTVSSTWDRSLSPPAGVPASADVVIIGGGIVGVSTAWFLAKQGVNVVLCEKGHIAGEQSGRNWGWVRQQGRDVRELPMMIESTVAAVTSCSVAHMASWQGGPSVLNRYPYYLCFLICKELQFIRYGRGQHS